MITLDNLHESMDQVRQTNLIPGFVPTIFGRATVLDHLVGESMKQGGFVPEINEDLLHYGYLGYYRGWRVQTDLRGAGGGLAENEIIFLLRR